MIAVAFVCLSLHVFACELELSQPASLVDEEVKVGSMTVKTAENILGHDVPVGLGESDSAAIELCDTRAARQSAIDEQTTTSALTNRQDGADHRSAEMPDVSRAAEAATTVETVLSLPRCDFVVAAHGERAEMLSNSAEQQETDQRREISAQDVIFIPAFD